MLRGNKLQERSRIRITLWSAVMVLLSACGSVPQAPAPAEATGDLEVQTQVLDLLVSRAADRSSPKILDASEVSGTIYAYVEPDGVRQVSFYLNDSSRAGAPYRTEYHAPFDLGGTASNDLAKGFDTRVLKDGVNTLTTAIKYQNGTSKITTATFVVVNSAGSGLSEALLLSHSSNRLDAVPLDGQAVNDTMYVFLVPREPISKIEFFLDDKYIRREGQSFYDFGGTESDGTARAFDASALAGGEHTVGAIVTRKSGSQDEVMATFVVGEVAGPNAPFTIIALPDTQNYLCSRCTSAGREWQPEIFEAQTKWIADNINELSIAFVTHEGDIVECAKEDASRGCNQDGKDEWAAADKAMDILDGKVPYAAAIGDHDYFPEETRNGDTSNYVRYFGASRYQGYSWYGGSSKDELSHYQIFQAGGYTFLHLSLEFEPRDEIIAWAQDVIDANPGLPTIITTHSYLQDTPGAEGRSTSLDIEPPIGNTGQQLFKKLIEPNPQIFMVLNGHYHDSERSNGTETSDSGEYHQVSTNKEGSKVYEMLANYQSYDNGGDGWLRIIQFRPGGGANGLDRIAVRTYSPWRDEYQPGSASNFSFDLDFEQRFDLP